MRPIIYWKCNSTVSAKIIESWKEWRKLLGKANRLAKSIGAKEVYISSPFGSPLVSGFLFIDPPLKGFTRLKNTKDGWKPRMGTELEKKIREFQSDTIDLAAKLVGIDLFSQSEGVGVCINRTGFKIRGNTVYLSTTGSPTKGGKRISDIAFESL